MWIAWLWMASSGGEELTVQILPETPVTSSDLFAEVAGSGSPDGFWEWRKDGEVQADLLGPVVPASRTQKGERWKVEITSTTGDTVSAAVDVGNTPPEVSVYLPTFSPLASGIDALATTVDADQEGVSLTWSWRLNGTEVGLEGPSIAANELAAGQVWSVSVVPCDADGCGVAATAKTTVADQPPSVTALSIEPLEASAVDTLVAVVEGADPEGDVLSWNYIWEVDGVVVQESDSEELAPGSFFRGSDVRVIAQVSAGGQTDQFAASVEIGNAAPVVNEVTLDPYVPTIAGPVNCVYEVEDPDGDDVTVDILWAVNAIDVHAGPQIPGDVPSKS